MLAVLVLSISLAGSVSAQTALENELIENMAILSTVVENLEAQISILSAQLENAIAELSALIARFEAGEIGETILVRAWIGGEAVPLDGSKVDPGGQLLVAITDTAGNAIPDSSIEFNPPVFGGVLGFSYPASRGIVLVPILDMRGTWTGRAKAPYFKTVEFSFEVGEKEEETGERIHLTLASPAVVGEPNVLKAVDGFGNLVDGFIRIDDLDAEQAYRVQEGPNPLPFVPKTDSFTATFTYDNRRMMSTFSAEPPPGIGATPFVIIFILVGMFLLYKFRGKVPRRRITFPR